MRRDLRKSQKQYDELNMKIIKYSGLGVTILAVIVFGLLIYSKNLNNEVKEGTLTSKQISNILNNTGYNDNTESASTEIGKSINDISENIDNNIKNNVNTSNNIISSKEKEEVLTTDKIKPIESSAKSSKETENNTENIEKQEEIVLKFEMPVDGEIVREFAKESLIYSDTLQEWTTHNGIDIRAEKTTVVKSAESGTVKTIKNDPRYGLTIVIEHENGFQTVYSNLLTSEFVVEGEKVEKGQALGTVGNTAAFEIADEPHLHFEILKDLVQVDPLIYLK